MEAKRTVGGRGSPSRSGPRGEQGLKIAIVC
jgi:hypothetical protein